MKTTSERYLTQQTVQDLARKMVFVGGARQVGKTTMAKRILGDAQDGYLNWDIPQHREAILTQTLPNTPLWVFDELHKYSQWRQYLKGLYDQFGATQKILVTGSAHLDYYRHGGESLQGRYHHLRLHPFSVAELSIDQPEDFSTLLEQGGFPEQCFSGSVIEAKRWSNEYRQRLIQEDLLSLEKVKDLGRLELLMLRLPECVGSPLSINALREDLQVAHQTLANWLDIFERLYAIFRIPPFGAPTIRAVKKEQKHFHTDWTLVKDPGARFENMVAAHLHKWVEYEQDTQARALKLHYFRDIDGREVDFIITEDGKPITAIECKYQSTEVSKHLKYFKKRFPECRSWQLLATGDKDFVTADGTRVCHALKYLRALA